MIIDIIPNLANYAVVNRNISHVVDFLNSHSLFALTEGKHLIAGDDCFVLIFEYLTKTPDEIVWERHKKYLDVHVMISGEEQICFQNMNYGKSIAEYDITTDFEPFDAAGPFLRLHRDNFFLFHPHDLHKASVQYGDVPLKVRKAVFKLKI